MKNKFLLLLLFTFALNAQTGTGIIIKLKNHTSHSIEPAVNKTGIAALDAVASEHKALSVKKLYSGKRPVTLYRIAYPANEHPDAIIKDYMATGLVEYAEPDYIGEAGGKKQVSTTNAPFDQFYFRQWGLDNDGSFNMYPATAGADIEMENAWEIEEGSEDIIVAVMDSGLRLSHPEFEGRLWVNELEIPDNGIDDDLNGLEDDINGYDFAYDDNDPADDFGHGTNVTGIIAATGNNTMGYAGVDSHCKIMVLKGLDANNSGLYSWWQDAIIYAVDHGADIINLSVGGSSASATLESAIEYAVENGVVVVACMMNTNSSTDYYPAKYDGVIAVGSTNPDDRRSSPFFWDNNSGSNYGTHISVVAPGNFIYGLASYSDNDYDSYWGGTSQATPLVAGLAALLLAQDPERSPADIKEILESTAEDMVGDPDEDEEGFDIYYGHGRINAYNALSQSLSTADLSNRDRGIKIYPNPSDGLVTIESVQYPVEVTVHNYLGQNILSQSVTEASNNIHVKSSGVYIVSVKSDAEIVTSKIIIN